MLDLTTVYGWLNFWWKADPQNRDKSPDHLHKVTRHLVEDIKDALDDRDDDHVYELISELLDSDAWLDANERAEANVECAMAYSRLEKSEEAVECLNEAIKYYGESNLHYTAVVWCMIGCVLQEQFSKYKEACAAWRKSIQQFEKASRESMETSYKNFYTQHIEESMRELELQHKLKHPKGFSAPVVDESYLQLFQIEERVPAGGFGAVGYDRFAIGEVEVTQVIIEGKPHRIFNLRRSDHLVNLTDKHCVVIKVTGDSMNNPSSKTPSGRISVAIAKGDYVLLSEQQDAQSGDIVVAEIEDDADSLATLKRYTKFQGKILLEPESTNPVHQPFEFTAKDPRVHIRGVALAVFKPEKPHQ